MIRILLSIAAVSVAGLTTTAIAQEQCVAIENDVARLQCFDDAFANLRSEEVSPAVAFQALREFGYQDGKLAFDGNGVKLPSSEDFLLSYRMNDACDFEVLAMFLSPIGGRVEVNQTYLNLARVQNISQGNNNQVTVSLDRDGLVATKSATYFYRDLPNFEIGNIDLQWDFASRPTANDRTAGIYLTSEREDLQSASELFSQLVAACQAQ